MALTRPSRSPSSPAPGRHKHRTAGILLLIGGTLTTGFGLVEREACGCWGGGPCACGGGWSCTCSPPPLLTTAAGAGMLAGGILLLQ